MLERLDQPLATDLPLMREIRATVAKCLENGRDPKHPPFPELPTYANLSDAPSLYSGSFGLGSRDLQPEGVVGAIENMLSSGPQKRQFYLSIDFLRDVPITPKQELYQQTIAKDYPEVKDLSIRGSENPNLMPDDSITIRFHSVGGWGAITTGKNLAMTLYDLLGYHIKANPKYGSEKKGQPTTYYLVGSTRNRSVSTASTSMWMSCSPQTPTCSITRMRSAGLKDNGACSLSRATRDRGRSSGTICRGCTRR